MKIVISPDSFKECLPAWKVAEALATGWRKVLPGSQLCVCPWLTAAKARSKHSFMRLTVRFTLKVTGPLGESIHAQYGILGQPNHRSDRTGTSFRAGTGFSCPAFSLYTTSFGTGELILAARNTILIPLFYARVAVLQMMAVLG